MANPATLLTQTTHGVSPSMRALCWDDLIADAYFPLQLEYLDPIKFNGALSRWSLGSVSLSRLVSDPVSYTRRKQHISASREEEYLITIPQTSAVEFKQMGRNVRCDPGGFIIERGDEPYRFRYEKPNDLFVLKVSRSELSARVAQPDNLCARVFDATQGSARMFTSMVNLAQQNGADIDLTARDTLGRQLLEFLALALNSQPVSDDQAVSTVRAAHLTRIDRFIRQQLKNPELSPDLIATNCGISKRYLHDLYRTVNKTVQQQVRDYRLAASRHDLEQHRQEPLSMIAYRYAFADQAQFSRLFKAKYGITPSMLRKTTCL